MISDIDKNRIHREAETLIDAAMSIVVSSGDGYFLSRNYLEEKLNVIKWCVGFLESFTEEDEG